MARVLRGAAGRSSLSPLGARFLVMLAEQPGAVVSRDVLIDRLWSGNRLVGDPALNRLASEVRRAGAGAGGEAPLFETVRGLGYRLIPSAAPPGDRARRGSWPVRLLTIGAAIVVLGLLCFALILANGVVWGLAEPG